ncbi:hypothetical protein C7S18_06290 [Ahniella affigens]|uniref:Uncharacterized protein n=1 Tax=Ahniella affigens TaxID=2021234 RepID=A0A2P1PPU1_9GAMM|nr:hypothetical protein C7S18_06290 [Ahniella affigens]
MQLLVAGCRFTRTRGVTTVGIAGQPVEGDMINVTEAEALLGTLCVKYGFCLPPLWHARLVHCPPKSVVKFTDAVFHAEGLDPRTADSSTYAAVRAEVCAAFERSRASAAVLLPNPSFERRGED